MTERVDAGVSEAELYANLVDRYKLIAVVDSTRSFGNNECIHVSMNKNEISHLSVNSQTTLSFDELVSSYEQVGRIGRSMAMKFYSTRNTNKVVLNVADQFATNNNCGFNLANFKPSFMNDFFSEVVADYERSFIGAFSSTLIDQFCGPESGYEVYFTVSKFEGNMGYSLTQNYEDLPGPAQNVNDSQDSSLPRINVQPE